MKGTRGVLTFAVTLSLAFPHRTFAELKPPSNPFALRVAGLVEKLPPSAFEPEEILIEIRQRFNGRVGRRRGGAGALKPACTIVHDHPSDALRLSTPNHPPPSRTPFDQLLHRRGIVLRAISAVGDPLIVHGFTVRFSALDSNPESLGVRIAAYPGADGNFHDFWFKNDEIVYSQGGK